VILKYGIKKTTQKIGYLPENLGKRLSIDEQLFQWRTLYYFDHKAAKGKKGTIAMIAGTKAQTVIAIIEK
jgi:hypothetical protein